MAENQGKCTGNCMACTIIQRQLCASQVSYYNMKMMEQLSQAVTELQEGMIDLTEKIEAIQNSEADVFNPVGNVATESPHTPITQEGHGVIQ